MKNLTFYTSKEKGLDSWLHRLENIVLLLLWVKSSPEARPWVWWANESFPDLFPACWPDGHWYFSMAIFLQYKIYTKLLTVPEFQWCHRASLVASCNKSKDDHPSACGYEVPSSTRSGLQTSATLQPFWVIILVQLFRSLARKTPKLFLWSRCIKTNPLDSSCESVVSSRETWK